MKRYIAQVSLSSDINDIVHKMLKLGADVLKIHNGAIIFKSTDEVIEKVKNIDDIKSIELDPQHFMVAE